MLGISIAVLITIGAVARVVFGLGRSHRRNKSRRGGG